KRQAGYQELLAERDRLRDAFNTRAREFAPLAENSRLLLSELERLEQGDAENCPTCQQPLLSSKARERVVSLKRGESLEAERKLVALEQERVHQGAELAKIEPSLAESPNPAPPDEAGQLERARLEERIASSQGLIDAVDGEEFKELYIET